MSSATIIIPARFASTRFPGKPLAKILGTSMLERVWRIAKASGDNRVIIATDSDKIFEHGESFGAEVVMSSESCRTGTDRVAEVSKTLKLEDEIVVSFQGDSVLTPPSVLKDLLSVFDKSPEINMATPGCLLEGAGLKEFISHKRQGSTTGTMVVFDNNFNALYFSRSIIPFSREASSEDLNEDSPQEIYRHIGIYAYKAKTLSKLSSLEMSRLEKLEKLEQLRALENGIGIKVVPVSFSGRTAASVDSPEDIEIVEQIIKREGELVL